MFFNAIWQVLKFKSASVITIMIQKLDLLQFISHPMHQTKVGKSFQQKKRAKWSLCNSHPIRPAMKEYSTKPWNFLSKLLRLSPAIIFGKYLHQRTLAAVLCGRRWSNILLWTRVKSCGNPADFDKSFRSGGGHERERSKGGGKGEGRTAWVL